MKLFRVLRGKPGSPPGKRWGMTWEANTAREAVAADEKRMDELEQQDRMSGFWIANSERLPISEVYELTLVDESEWR